MTDKSQLDLYDQQIIKLLSIDGRLPVTELARRIGISKSPCQVRLKRLQEEGYILGFRAIINQSKLQRDHVAFAEVRLTDTREEALDEFNAAIKDVSEIEQCHLIAGSFDYLLKVRTSDINAYRKVLAESISRLPYIANTSTYVSMQSIKDSS